MTGWILLGLFLLVRIDYALFPNADIELVFPLFLPLMTAVVAYRYGVRVFAVLTVLAIPAMFGVGWYMTDLMYVYFEYSSLVFLLSIVTAIAFCRPAPGVSLQELVNNRFRWTRWLMLVALWLMLHYYATFEYEVNSDLSFDTNIGAIALVVLVAMSLDWRKFTALFRELVLTSESRWRNRFRTAVWILLAAAVVVSTYSDFGYVFDLAFGFADSGSILLVALVVVTVLGILDWRIAFLAVAAIVISEDLTDPLYEWIESVMVEDVPAVEPAGGTTSEGVLEAVVVTGSRIRRGAFFFGFNTWFVLLLGLCFGLLGEAVRQAWQEKNPEALRSRRAMIYCVLAVTVALASVPLNLTSFGFVQYLVLLPAGLLIGYRWQYRAIILAPIILVFAFLTLGLALAMSFEQIPSAFNAVNILFVAFPATLIGVLLSRNHRKEASVR